MANDPTSRFNNTNIQSIRGPNYDAHIARYQCKYNLKFSSQLLENGDYIIRAQHIR